MQKEGNNKEQKLMKMKTSATKVNKTSWFFEKIVTDKPLARVIKKEITLSL